MSAKLKISEDLSLPGRATGKPGVLFLCPRLTTDLVTPVDRGWWMSRCWTVNSMLLAGDFAAVVYWDNPPMVDSAVLAAADGHAEDFAKAFPAGMTVNVVAGAAA